MLDTIMMMFKLRGVTDVGYEMWKHATFHRYNDDIIQEIVRIFISLCCKFIGVHVWQNVSK